MKSINELRQSLDMTQKQFAEFTGIPYRTIQNWEGNVNVCPLYVLAMLDTCIKHKSIWYSEDFLSEYAKEKK